MPFNHRPLRPVTDAKADLYAREGVVCLRRVFDPEWLESLAGPARELLIARRDFGLLPNNPGRYMARVIPAFRRFAFESPMAEAAGQVLRSREIRFFFDEIFAKGPQSEEKTIWHCDRMGGRTDERVGKKRDPEAGRRGLRCRGDGEHPAIDNVGNERAEAAKRCRHAPDLVGRAQPLDEEKIGACLRSRRRPLQRLVEAGCTWARLDEALAPHGLRTPFWGPMSGRFATIGGARRHLRGLPAARRRARQPGRPVAQRGVAGGGLAGAGVGR